MNPTLGPAVATETDPDLRTHDSLGRDDRGGQMVAAGTGLKVPPVQVASAATEAVRRDHAEGGERRYGGGPRGYAGGGERRHGGGPRGYAGGGERRHSGGPRGYAGGGERRYGGGPRDHAGGGERRYGGGPRDHAGGGERRYGGGPRDHGEGGERRYGGGPRGYAGGGERRHGGGPRGYAGGGGERRHGGGPRGYAGGGGERRYGGGPRGYAGGGGERRLRRRTERPFRQRRTGRPSWRWLFAGSQAAADHIGARGDGIAPEDLPAVVQIGAVEVLPVTETSAENTPLATADRPAEALTTRKKARPLPTWSVSV